MGTPTYKPQNDRHDTACSNSRPQPPTTCGAPQNFLNPSFANLGFWGKGWAPKAHIFCALPEGEVFLSRVSILKILRILCIIQKCLKNTKKNFDHWLTSRSDLGG